MSLKICGFCGGTGESLDEGGVMLELREKGGTYYAHELCAVFSPGTDVELGVDDYEVGSFRDCRGINQSSVVTEMRRGKQLRCTLCDAKGASIGCFVCSRRCFHYPCAQRAGLIEWHWWRSGHRGRVVHCVEHQDPRCEVYYDGDDDDPPGWYSACVVDGPQQGRYLCLYTGIPFGQEIIAPCEVEIKAMKPPTGAGCWTSFAQVIGSEAQRKGRGVRCVVDGRPLDAIANRSRRLSAPDGLSGRPLAVLASDRARSADAVHRAVEPWISLLSQQQKKVPTTSTPPQRTPPSDDDDDDDDDDDGNGVAAVLSRLFDACLDFATVDDVFRVSHTCVLLRIAAKETRLPRTMLLRMCARIGIDAETVLRCFPDDDKAPEVRAWRWLCGRWKQWAACLDGAKSDHAGPGATSVRVARGELSRTGTRSGDVTVACLRSPHEDDLFRNALVCFQFLLTVTPAAPGDAVAVGLSTPLGAPSPIWLGREPRSSTIGFGLALAPAVNVFHTSLLPADVQLRHCNPNQSPLHHSTSFTLGVVLDSRGPVLAFYRNSEYLGIAIEPNDFAEENHRLKSILETGILRPAVALTDPGWRARIVPAVPCRVDDDSFRPPYDLPRRITSVDTFL